MKRIGLIGAISALSMALFVPAAVSAHSPHQTPIFWADVVKATCTHRGGQHGYGRVALQMHGFARNDVSGAETPNYIKLSVWFQQKIDGEWIHAGLGGGMSLVYPDGHPEVFDYFPGAYFHFEAADHPRTRLRMKLEFFDDLPNGDVRIGKISARTEAC